MVIIDLKLKQIVLKGNKVKGKVKIKVKANSVYTVNASGEFRGKGVEQGLLKILVLMQKNLIKNLLMELK